MQEQALEERINYKGELEYSGRTIQRYVLVMDCQTPHEFSFAADLSITIHIHFLNVPQFRFHCRPQRNDMVNLQYYVIKEKRLTEKEAVVIFYDIVRVVNNLHEVL